MTSAGVKSDQLVVFWFGGVNHVGNNDTEEGQAKNRRVEIAVGGLK